MGTCNPLRLWKAEAVESFDFAAFNHGDYYRAVEDKMQSENITKVLYPNDEVIQGKTLRLQQQFFFVTCSLQDMIRVHLLLKRPLDTFHEKWAVQLNDTHPAIAVAELMRLLVDEHAMDWDTAWHVTRNTFAYTNHTLLPEALEKWPVGLFGQLLPRHLEIIYEINRALPRRGAREVPGRRRPRGADVAHRRERRALRAHGPSGDGGQPSRQRRGATALRPARADGDARLRRAVAGEVLQRDQRRHAAPVRGRQQSAAGAAHHRAASATAGCATSTSSASWSRWPTTRSSSRQWREVKLAAKRDLAALIEQRTGITVNPESLFDVQVKRLHEYKRQHLNVLHILTLYLRLKRDPQADVPAAHVHLRRQGRARLRHGQAHHQADQLRGRRGERRPRRARPAQGGVLPRLQREERAARLSRPPTCPSRSPPPARKPPAPAT